MLFRGIAAQPFFKSMAQLHLLGELLLNHPLETFVQRGLLGELLLNSPFKLLPREALWGNCCLTVLQEYSSATPTEGIAALAILQIARLRPSRENCCLTLFQEYGSAGSIKGIAAQLLFKSMAQLHLSGELLLNRPLRMWLSYAYQGNCCLTIL